MSDNSRVVIVGAGQAGAALAAKLRQLGHRGAVTLIGDENYPPYQRPPLTKAFLLGEIDQEMLWIRSPGYWLEKSVKLKLGKPVKAIDRQTKRVLLQGESVAYDQLVIATGSIPIEFPASAGGNLGRVFTIRSLSEAYSLKDRMRDARSVVVIGGGYIGLEAAAVARKMDLMVTIVEASDRILNRVASPETSGYFRNLHHSNGVSIIESAFVKRILGENEARGVLLSDGRDVAADVVIVGIGAKPNTVLAECAELTIDNGIATDEYGLTSDSDIWAVGDCASFPWRKQRMRLESVGHAIDHAETVAANIVGENTPYQPRPWFWSEQYDTKLQIAGLNTGYDHLVSRTLGGSSFWYYRNRELIAVDAAGDTRAYMVGKRLIDAGLSPEPDMVKSVIDLKELLR